MPESTTPVTTDALPRIVRVALAQGSSQAVSAIAGAFGLQFTQPTLTPEQAAAWQTCLLETAAMPLLVAWDSLEPAMLPAAGTTMLVALLRQLIEQTSVVLVAVRQHLPPPPTEAPSPGTGGGA
jgi:hypothetical protein